MEWSLTSSRVTRHKILDLIQDGTGNLIQVDIAPSLKQFKRKLGFHRMVILDRIQLKQSKDGWAQHKMVYLVLNLRVLRNFSNGVMLNNKN